MNMRRDPREGLSATAFERLAEAVDLVRPMNSVQMHPLEKREALERFEEAYRIVVGISDGPDDPFGVTWSILDPIRAGYLVALGLHHLPPDLVESSADHGLLDLRDMADSAIEELRDLTSVNLPHDHPAIALASWQRRGGHAPAN